MAQARKQNTKPAQRPVQRQAAKRPAQPQRAAKPSNDARVTSDSNRFEVTGEIHEIMEAVEVSDRFTKREFVLNVTDNPKYPQLVSFQASGNGVKWLDDYAAGDAVTVHFNLRGREWRTPDGDTKYFNTLAAWKIEAAEQREEVADEDIPF